MYARQPSIRTGILTELQDYLAAQGMRLADLTSAANMPSPGPDSSTQPFPLNATMATFEEAAKKLGVPEFGCKFAQSVKPGATGLIGELVLTAPTVRDCLISTAQFIHVFMTPFQMAFTEEEGVGRLTWSYPSSITAPRVQFNLFMISVLILRIRAATGRDWIPLAVDLNHAAPPVTDVMHSILGPRLRFNMERSSIAFDGPTLALPMPTANPTRFAIMRDLATRWLAEVNTPPEIIEQTKTAIGVRLAAGRANLEQIASDLGMSPGSLQWRLERSETTFERILSDLRRSQAETSLRDTDKPLTEIAYDLGFSDPSAFTRAAQRWFGMSPRAWRRNQRSLVA